MSLLSFCICLLATYRLTSIVYQEEIASFIRKYIGGYDGISYPESFRGKLFDCFWCLSVWVGIFCTLLWYVDLSVLLYPFSMSAGAILLYEMKEKFL